MRFLLYVSALVVDNVISCVQRFLHVKKHFLTKVMSRVLDLIPSQTICVADIAYSYTYRCKR